MIKQNKKCPNCGKVIQESFSLCPYCGIRLQLPDAQTDKQNLTSPHKSDITSVLKKTSQKQTYADAEVNKKPEELSSEEAYETVNPKNYSGENIEESFDEEDSEYEENEDEKYDEEDDEEGYITEEVLPSFENRQQKEPVRFAQSSDFPSNENLPKSNHGTRTVKPYDPNHDGYYDDVTPEIIESYRKGLQIDVLLKALFCIVGVVAAIFYLIYV